MTILAASNLYSFGLLLIAASAIAFYVAARVAVDSLTNLDHPSPSRLALAHWIPVAFVAITAVITGHPIIGVCVALGTSVAALTLNLGLITATTGDDVGVGEFSRAWPFLVPAALIAFIAGFSATLNWVHAIIFLIEALLIAIVWFAPASRDGSASTFAPPDPLTLGRWLSLLLAALVALLAAIIGVYGTFRMSIEVPLTTPGLIAAVGLSPLLVLPMIGTGTLLAERRRSTVAATSLVGLTLLNLCVLLPLLIVIWICRRVILGTEEIPNHIPFPIAAWRVDTVLILIAGALLTPVALGRWRLGRSEGVILVITYAAYLGATSILATRW